MKRFSVLTYLKYNISDRDYKNTQKKELRLRKPQRILNK